MGAEINSNLWRAFSILKKQKKGNPTKIKWKKVPSKFSEISVMNAWFVSKIISFNFNVITGRYLRLHEKLTL